MKTPLTPSAFLLAAVLSPGCAPGSHGHPSPTPTPTPAPLVAPSIATEGSYQAVHVSWAAVAGASSYHVYASTAPIGDPPGSTPIASTSLAADVAGLANWVPEHVRVAAVDGAGNEGALSAEAIATPTAGWFVTSRLGSAAIDVTRADAAGGAPVVSVADRSFLPADNNGGDGRLTDAGGAVVGVVYGHYFANPDLYSEIGILRGETPTVIAPEDPASVYQYRGWLRAPDGDRVVLNVRDRATYASTGVETRLLDGSGAVTIASGDCAAALTDPGRGLAVSCLDAKQILFGAGDAAGTPLLTWLAEPGVQAIRDGWVILFGGEDPHSYMTWAVSTDAAHTQRILAEGPLLAADDAGRVLTIVSGTSPAWSLWAGSVDGSVSNLMRASSNGAADVIDVSGDGERVLVHFADMNGDGIPHLESIPLDVSLAKPDWPYFTDGRFVDGGYVVQSGALRVDDAAGQELRQLGGTFLEDAQGPWVLSRTMANELISENVDGLTVHVLSTKVGSDARETLLPSGRLTFVDDDGTPWFAALDGSVDHALPGPVVAVRPLTEETGRLAVRLDRDASGSAGFGVLDETTGSYTAVVTTAWYGAFVAH